MISDDDEIRINRDGITIGEDKVVINKDGIFVDGRIAADSDGIVIENDGDNSIVINGNNISVNGNNVNIDKAAGFAIAGVAIAIAIVVGVIALIVGVFSIALDLFVFKPIEYGCRKFFKEAHSGNPRLSLIFSGFTDGYMNIVKVLFFRDLFIFLWSLLFIIPGIVKSYEYRMVPYLLSENPKMSKDEATKLSSRMMKGNKWKAFVLDLSFIGWHILSALTMDILGIFYVKPYQQATNAALYLALKEEDPDGFPVGGSTPGEDTPAIAAE
ncbi:MAG: DUF975 family protein [Lachnospiraceae bacterium]|nr:DUF975 family protein [Lachnospiraceae bacterium]